jgi:hypothetical protein
MRFEGLPSKRLFRINVHPPQSSSFTDPSSGVSDDQDGFRVAEDDTTVRKRLLVDDLRGCHALENRWVLDEARQ